MFNTINLIKLGASMAATLLFVLLVNWGASSIYNVVEESHGDGEEHAVVRGFAIAPETEDEEDSGEPEVEMAFADYYAVADAAAGEKEFGKCKACHKLEDGAHATGPSLYGVVDRPMAAADGFGYSDALLALQGQSWTPEEIDAYIANPREYAPGNKMTFAGLKDAEDRANLIAYLATIGG